MGEPYDDTDFSGRSDYQAFIDNGIPSGGLFTGAEEVKTAEQQAIWGGTAGEQFDPCYHQACDTFDNVDLHALDVNSDLIAFAQLTFAYSTESVNGVPGKKVPGPPAPCRLRPDRKVPNRTDLVGTHREPTSSSGAAAFPGPSRDAGFARALGRYASAAMVGERACRRLAGRRRASDCSTDHALPVDAVASPRRGSRWCRGT